MRWTPTLLAGLLGALLAGGSADRPVAAADAPANPHGDPAACTACHAPGASPSQPGAPLPVVQTCRSCHPTADMHPVGMAPSRVTVAAGWPLEDGKVTCATCHAEPAHGGEAAALPAPWHRGGPYPSVTRFCYACHDAAGYTQSDPHRPAKPGDPADPSCAACHTGTPAKGASLDQARLRAGPDAACTGTCHSEPPHAGVAEHLGKAVPADVAAALPATLTLHQGQIACYTCHEVHTTSAAPSSAGRRALAQGLRAEALSGDWAALAGAEIAWPDGADPHAMLAESAADGGLCQACHGVGP